MRWPLGYNVFECVWMAECIQAHLFLGYLMYFLEACMELVSLDFLGYATLAGLLKVSGCSVSYIPCGLP